MIVDFSKFTLKLTPCGELGGYVKNVSSVAPACCKRCLNGAVSQNNGIKRVAPCWFLDGHVKNLTKCLWRWEPDHRSNFFVSPPSHLCAVKYMTEISLHVMLSNQSHSLTI